MKYGIMEKAMWAMYAPSFKRELKLIGADGRIMKAAKKKYREIIGTIDEFDKEDRYLVNILSCAMYAAILLNAGVKPSKEAAERYYHVSMNKAFPSRFVPKLVKRYYTKKGKEELIRQAEWSENNKNPYSWRFSVKWGESINEYTATFHTCGICYLMEKYGLSEYTSGMCSYDYDMAEAGDSDFYREHTIAGGGERMRLSL